MRALFTPLVLQLTTKAVFPRSRQFSWTCLFFLALEIFLNNIVPPPPPRFLAHFYPPVLSSSSLPLIPSRSIPRMPTFRCHVFRPFSVAFLHTVPCPLSLSLPICVRRSSFFNGETAENCSQVRFSFLLSPLNTGIKGFFTSCIFPRSAAALLPALLPPAEPFLGKKLPIFFRFSLAIFFSSLSY